MKKRGKCYEKAFDFVQEHRDYLMVHGRIFPAKNKVWIDHAWCENESACFDPQKHNRAIPKSQYYGNLTPKINRTFTAGEARLLAFWTHNYGPWSTKEVKASLRDPKKTMERACKYLREIR